MVRPYDLTRWRGMASRSYRHELAMPVRQLCDEVELLQRQLSALVEELHRTRRYAFGLDLPHDTNRRSGDGADKQSSDIGSDAEVDRVRQHNQR